MNRTTPIMSSCHMNNTIASVCAPSKRWGRLSRKPGAELQCVKWSVLPAKIGSGYSMSAIRSSYEHFSCHSVRTPHRATWETHLASKGSIKRAMAYRSCNKPCS